MGGNWRKKKAEGSKQGEKVGDVSVRMAKKGGVEEENGGRKRTDGRVT